MVFNSDFSHWLNTPRTKCNTRRLHDFYLTFKTSFDCETKVSNLPDNFVIVRVISTGCNRDVEQYVKCLVGVQIINRKNRQI